jgi:hypothetical protein
MGGDHKLMSLLLRLSILIQIFTWLSEPKYFMNTQKIFLINLALH